MGVGGLAWRHRERCLYRTNDTQTVDPGRTLSPRDDCQVLAHRLSTSTTTPACPAMLHHIDLTALLQCESKSSP